MTTGQVSEPDLPVGPPGSVDDLLVALRAAPSSLQQMRAELTRWLAAAGWPEDDAEDIVLAANEAMSNVVDHAYPARRPGPVHVHAWVSANQAARTRHVTVAVTDHGDWAHQHRSTELAGYRGHGLTVMSGCMADVHIQRSSGGTTVVLVGNNLPTHPDLIIAP
ncbi:ATP-binding protein [Pseudonocardia sp. MH-G8]|uniref:ATP-binding protein n=1 Tax=Pseudonocardia sp. MH-G8 TaxID=1854588 RepID=UPI0013046A54|nr:ATP-binding protein [Pseudonocardia sp. MH-G8]